MKIVALVSFLILSFTTSRIVSQQCHFQSPVSGPIISSGSYGEPRTAHFHAGIDFKQNQGIPYDTIFAVESGRISRIVIRPDGYGNALYIDHPCGKTSVYAHLYEFAPEITRYAQELMYREESYTLNHNLKSTELTIFKGEAIGIMGSTGRSSGPHLHFEIRNTQSEKSTNPALYGIKPRDNIAPVIRGVVIYKLTPDGQELESTYHPAYKGKSGVYQLTDPVLTSGSLLVGIGIHTYDTMNGAKNHNGIYAAEIKVDGESEFRFKLDSLAFNNSQHLHSHMDYNYKIANRYVTKLFKNPGNPLDIYRLKQNGGEIALFNTHSRYIEIRVFDIDRNRSELQFQIERNPSLSPYITEQTPNTKRLTSDRKLIFNGQNTTVHIPAGTVSAPTWIELNSDILDSIHLYQSANIPLFKPIIIEQRIPSRIYPEDKYILLSKNNKEELQRHECEWKNASTITCLVPELKNYWVAIDSIAPHIEVISLPNSFRKRGIVKIQDNFNATSSAGSVEFNIYLDNKWLLCQHDIKTHRIWWDMKEVSASRKHHLRVVAKDASGNTSTIEKTFTR